MTRRTSIGAAALIAAVQVLPGTGQAARPATEAVWLETNLGELYPSPAEVCLSTYRQTKETPGVVLELQTDLEGFSHFRYALRRDSLPREPDRVSENGSIPVTFDPGNPRPQRVEAVIHAVSRSGRRSRPFSIELGYYPREHYAAAGQRTRNWVVVHATDLVRCGTSVEDWIVERPSPSERAYARKRWARLVKPLATDYDKARAIARDLIRALRPHEGIPSDAMKNASPLEQLARAESGRDRVWCGNYADIFSAACNALDIPVRKIDMQHVWSTEGKTVLEIGEAHRTTEVFDRELDRWIWMDLTFGHWGARLGDGELLHMADLVRALHDERQLERLQIVEFDDERGVEELVPIVESRRGKDLFRFFRTDQRYQYVRRAAAALP